MSNEITCELCGESVAPATGPGRSFLYRRGLTLPVPDDFAIPTCVGCGELYLSEADHKALARAQQPAFMEWQRQHLSAVLDSIKETHGVRARDIERACGVTTTYLSHLIAGRNEASDTLLRLLEAFDLNPSEFHRCLSGTSWAKAKFAAIQPAIRVGTYFPQGVESTAQRVRVKTEGTGVTIEHSRAELAEVISLVGRNRASVYRERTMRTASSDPPPPNVGVV